MGQNREVFITGGLIAGEVATNRALAPNSTIGGGYKSNTINAAGDNSTIAAGEQNTINSKNSFIGAGRENIIEQNAE
ncbi:MAG: hypothetical protein LBU27_00040 [Candidatus Peribacteria bacterium]|jgi:hypothetical protein|nr:hypothetical protein [Candidatus Peribacteria bacterium]